VLPVIRSTYVLQKGLSHCGLRLAQRIGSSLNLTDKTMLNVRPLHHDASTVFVFQEKVAINPYRLKALDESYSRVGLVDLFSKVTLLECVFPQI